MTTSLTDLPGLRRYISRTQLPFLLMIAFLNFNRRRSRDPVEHGLQSQRLATFQSNFYELRRG